MFRKFSQWFDPSPPRAQSNDRCCAYFGCHEKGAYRAPKSRDHLEQGMDDWHWFCLIHIRDYNNRWNYYLNMSEGEIERERRADATWQRPSWTLGSHGESRRHKMSRGQLFQDPFDLFNDPFDGQRYRPSSQETPVSLQSAEAKALAILDMSFPFTLAQLQKQYRALVKKHHPDANGGSLEAEEALKRINEAYGILKGLGR